MSSNTGPTITHHLRRIMAQKISIRFYNDHEVRAIWDDENNKWWFSVLDVVGAINGQDDYARTRNYWKYLKAKLRKSQSEVVSVANQLKLSAPDGKHRMTDVLDFAGVMLLAQNIPNTNAARFVHWFASDSDSIDGKSREKAYALWESGLMKANSFDQPQNILIVGCECGTST